MRWAENLAILNSKNCKKSFSRAVFINSAATKSSNLNQNQPRCG